VPAGFQEVAVALEPERAVGGELGPGDTVGVAMSFEPFDLPGTEDLTPSQTHLTFHKVLVTAVQFDQNDAAAADAASAQDDENPGADVERAPSLRLLVTLAMKAPEVEQVVFAAEFGHIWLTAENADADQSGTRVVTLGEAHEAGVAR
jgi:pilus assembly protein CpaB